MLMEISISSLPLKNWRDVRLRKDKVIKLKKRLKNMTYSKKFAKV